MVDTVGYAANSSGHHANLLFSDVAATYPDADVTGIDVAPTQELLLQENVHFEVDDIRKGWNRSAESYDLIFSRRALSIVMDWEDFAQGTYKSLEQGGRIELSELLLHFSNESGQPLGENNPWSLIEKEVQPHLPNLEKVASCLRNAGYGKVHVHYQRIPLRDCKDIILEQLQAYLCLSRHFDGAPLLATRGELDAWKDDLVPWVDGVWSPR